MRRRSLACSVVVLAVANLATSLAASGTPLADSATGRARAEPAPAQPQVKAKTMTDAWRLLRQATGHACTEAELFFDYGYGGGVRNFYCRALTIFSWQTFLSLAPAKPFLSGPHRNNQLNLHAATDFGRYNPAFVRWLAHAAVPAVTNPALRRETQEVYDAQVRELARTYYAVYRKLQSAPDWVARHSRLYAEAVERGDANESMWELSSFMGPTGLMEPPKDYDFGGYDASQQRTAVMFWLRRTLDTTAPLFFEGLSTLIHTYDEGWLKKGMPSPEASADQ